MFVIGGNATFGNVGKKQFKVEDGDQKSDKAEVAKTETTPLNKKEKARVEAIVLVTAFSVVFCVVWYLAYMPVYYHWGPDFDYANKANWIIGNFTVPSAWFDSLNALACITLGPVLSMVWGKLAKSPKHDLSMFKKTALGMLLLESSFVVMALAEVVRGDGQANLMWILVFRILLSLGEMVFSPTQVLGLMMGVWPFTVFIAGKSYGYLYEYLSKFSFAPAYSIVAAVVIGFGVVLWSLDKKLNKLVEEDDNIDAPKISVEPN